MELGPCLGHDRALVEEEDLGEVFAETRPCFLVGAGNRTWRAGCDCGRVGQLGDGGVRSIADDVAAPSRVLFQDTPEELREIGNVHGRPVLPPGSDHDQVSVIVSRRTEQESGNPATAVAVRGPESDHDTAHVVRAEYPPFDGFLPRHQHRRIEW